MADSVLEEHALPTRAYNHPTARLVAHDVALDLGACALTQHDAVLVLIDLIVRDRALRLAASYVDACVLPAVDAVVSDEWHTIVADRDADTLICEHVVVGQRELRARRVPVREIRREGTNPPTSMAVYASHARTRDAILLEKWCCEALHFDVPLAVVADIIVDEVALPSS